MLFEKHVDFLVYSANTREQWLTCLFNGFSTIGFNCLFENNGFGACHLKVMFRALVRNSIDLNVIWVTNCCALNCSRMIVLHNGNFYIQFRALVSVGDFNGVLNLCGLNNCLILLCVSIVWTIGPWKLKSMFLIAFEIFGFNCEKLGSGLLRVSIVRFNC